jgi:transposase
VEASQPHKPTGVVADDPGIRDGHSLYSAHGQGCTFLSQRGGDGQVLLKLGLKADDIQSRMMQRAENDGVLSESHRRRQKMRRAKWRLFRKKKDLMRDSHFKFAKYLSQTYRVFIIPAFAVASIVEKPAKIPRSGDSDDEEDRGHKRRQPRRLIPKSSVKAVLNWNHYGQRETILQLAERTPGFTAVVTTEPYTTVTCSTCGTMRPQFPGKVFQCTNRRCQLICDRDINAAKNILLRYCISLRTVYTHRLTSLTRMLTSTDM